MGDYLQQTQAAKQPVESAESQNYSDDMQEKYDGMITSEEQIHKGSGGVTFQADKKGSTGDNYFKKLTGEVGMPGSPDTSTNLRVGDFQQSYNDVNSDETLFLHQNQNSAKKRMSLAQKVKMPAVLRVEKPIVEEPQHLFVESRQYQIR